MTNERGIALVVTLLVVALLTIIVVEFTYSVQVDAHMTRNALNALQASLLARSGINLGEAALLHDDDDQMDAYTEDWGNVDQLNSLLILPENMWLRVQIIDESGKLNLNLTRPRSVVEWKAARNVNPNAQNQFQPPFKRWTTALGNLLGGRGASPQIAETVSEYWDQLFQTLAGSGSPGIPGQPAVPTPGLTPTPGMNQAANPNLWDFPSLDDASVIPGLSPSLIRRSRSVLTALDALQQRLNVNTAPQEVLSAIVPDAGVVENIISQRQDHGIAQRDLPALLAGANQPGQPPLNLQALLGTTSSYFLIRASATVNPNPITGKGGISRSASMLVRRAKRPCVPPRNPPTAPCWTLTQLDWQKEGGAALLQPRTDQEPGADGLPNSGLPGTGG
ncbi:MAG: general secretion pathway protein GspK [Candidatus Binatia bacterium]